MSDRSSPRPKPDSEAFENDIRRMLARRAADVDDGPAAPPLPTVGRDDSRPVRPGRWLTHVLAAAAAVTAIAGLGGLYIAQSRSTTTEAGVPVSWPLSSEAPPTSTTAAPGAPTPAGAILDDVLASIPPGVDPVSGPPVYRGTIGELPEAAVRDYLTRRLPDLSFELVQTDSVEPLVVYRWSVDDPDYRASGSVVVRKEPDGPVVTLATTDGITFSSLERTADRLAAVVLDDDPARGLLAADVTTLDGTIVGDSTATDSTGKPGPPTDFGSAGLAEGAPLSFELTLAPIPVVVRVQRVGGTMLSITELTVEPTAFPLACGDAPPVRIDVGSQLGPLQVGPAPQSSVEPLANQGVWHHPGPVNTIEIRWPADPTRLARLAPDGAPPDQVMGQQSGAGAANGAGPGLSAGYVLAPVEPTNDARAADPCSVVQIAIYGDAAAVEWWHTALQGEWSFGLPLTVADLDPSVGPDGSGGGLQLTDELVVGSDRSDQRPQVPDGACDGLPGAPPQQGTGDGTVSATAETALEAFLAATAATVDPPLPTAGYTEVQIDASTISYVVVGDRSPVVVVDLRLTAAGWIVDHWAASPC